MTAPEASERALFDDAPPTGLQRRLGLLAPGDMRIGRRALLVILVGWVPLVLLALAQSAMTGRGEAASLLWEVGVHARYLAAAPLLVLAEAVCVPQLNAIVRHFVDGGLVPEHERKHYDAAVASTRRLLSAPAAEIAVIALAYVIAAAAAMTHTAQELPVWAQSGGTTPVFSLAGWWHMLVSLPLLLVLFLGWMWRLALWTRLLWLIARLDLRLVASHPDHVAGLSFVGHSLRAFSLVALAIAAIAAGRSAHVVLTGGGLPTPHLYFNVGLFAVVLALFTAPLIVFSPTLNKVWRRGTAEYGVLADRVGHAFERQWLGREGQVDDKALERPDFSATADLYAVTANVHALRFVPVDAKDIAALAIAMLIPFIPVVLLAVPADAIWSGIKGLLF
jgi:hypothetical protein